MHPPLGFAFAAVRVLETPPLGNQVKPNLRCDFLWLPQIVQFSSIQFSRSVVSNSLRPHESQHTRPPVRHQLPEFIQTQVHRVSDAIQPSHPLSSPSSPAPIPPSIRVFSNESTLRMRWPKCWSFSFSIIPSKEIPGLISIRMDRLDVLAVQGTLKSLLQNHSSKTSILRHSAFFTIHLSQLYVTTGKNRLDYT